MSLSVVIVTLNEEANIARTLDSVRWADERIVLDCGSTDRTQAIARECGATVFEEAWKGYAAQKNSAIAKASSDWVLSLDADEEVTQELASEIRTVTSTGASHCNGYFMARRNLFMGRWIRHGGFYPDRKLRLVRRGTGHFAERAVHETMRVTGATANLRGDLIHHAYPTLTGYIETMNRYSSLGAQVALERGHAGKWWLKFVLDVWVRPAVNFKWNYIFRGGFLDGREGLLLHLYHNAYVSLKYAKAWELARGQKPQR
jgi:glycosyltransferase involved in cell wall biosynthesis